MPVTEQNRQPAYDLPSTLLARLFAGLVLGGLVLAACGGKSSTSSSAGTSTATATAPEVRAATNAKFGRIVVDAQGMTLYHNTAEVGGTVACAGGCTSVWPPLLVPDVRSTPIAGQGLAGTLATKARPDGAVQVTYNGVGLYRYANDHQPGDTNGQGIGNIWFVVTVASSAAPTSSLVPATTAPTAVTATTARTTVAPRPAVTAAPTTTSTPTTTAPSTTTAPPRTTTTTKYCLYPPCY